MNDFVSVVPHRDNEVNLIETEHTLEIVIFHRQKS